MRESNLQRRVLSQVWVARPASVRLQTLRGGLSCGGKEGKGVLVSPALSSAALPPSPQRRAGEAHGCGWVAGLGGALLAHPPPPSSLLFLFQARQLPRNPLHSVTSRGRQSPSRPTAFWELLHPRLGHLPAPAAARPSLPAAWQGGPGPAPASARGATAPIL